VLGVHAAGGVVHDFFLTGLTGFEDGHKVALMKDGHAVRHAENLGQFRTDHDDPNALRCKFVEQFVDREFGADVDAAGGLVEEQHP
jgi:hypothetical protein